MILSRHLQIKQICAYVRLLNIIGEILMFGGRDLEEEDLASTTPKHGFETFFLMSSWAAVCLLFPHSLSLQERWRLESCPLSGITEVFFSLNHMLMAPSSTTDNK